MTPQQLTPPYWINMGALAITTLAGSRLMLVADKYKLLVDILPFIKGFTLFFWSTATWWIPLLILLGVWRHGIQKIPLQYDPQYWGMVFPLGMYTACTIQLSRTIGEPFLMFIPAAFIYAALFAWALTFIGMVLSVGRLLVERKTNWGKSISNSALTVPAPDCNLKQPPWSCWLRSYLSDDIGSNANPIVPLQQTYIDSKKWTDVLFFGKFFIHQNRKSWDEFSKNGNIRCLRVMRGCPGLLTGWTGK